MVGHDLDSNRVRLGEGETSRTSTNGVPFGASGPPYLRAGFKISPDFFRISLELKGDMTTLLALSLGEGRGMIPVKSNFNPFSRRRGGTIALARVETVCNDVSDFALTGARRGMKLFGEKEARPMMVEDDETEEGDEMGSMNWTDGGGGVCSGEA